MATMNAESQTELNNRLDEMRDDAFHAQKARYTLWQDGLLYTFGDQRTNETVKDGWDPIVHNHIFPAMMQELAILSQRRTTILARPQEESDTDGSAIWQQHLQWMYEEELRMTWFLMRAKLDGQIYGNYLSYHYWEPKAEWDDAERRWRGAMRIKLVSPEYCAWDPETDLFETAEYIVTRRRMPKDQAVDRWPKFKELLESAPTTDQYDWTRYWGGLHLSTRSLAYDDAKDPGTAIRDVNRLTHLLTRAHRQQMTGRDLEAHETKYVNVEQYFFRDRMELRNKQQERIPEGELVDEGIIKIDDRENGTGGYVFVETGEAVLGKDWPMRKSDSPMEPGYPHGRIVLRVDGQILNPKTEDQRWSYRRWPFTLGVNQMLPHVPWGLNNTEMAINLQDRVNNTAMHIQNYVRKFSDPSMKIEEGALLEGSVPSNRAGAIIWTATNKNNGVTTDPAPPMSTALPLVQDRQAADLRDQTGVQEVGLGRSGSGDQTAREVIILQQESRLRSALSNKLMDMFIVDLFRGLAEQAARNYRASDMIRILGEGSADTVHKIKQGDLDARFDVKLETGTDLPFDQDVAKREAGEILASVGIAYLPQFLKAYNIKDIDEVLAAHGDYQAFLQFREALEEQQAEAEAAGGTEAQPATEQPQPAELTQ